MDPAQVAGPSRTPGDGVPAAKQVLSLVLQGAHTDSNGKGKAKAHPRPSANKRRTVLQSHIRSSQDVPASEHYTWRVEGRKLQLSNPDRPRPKAASGSVADQKLRRRDARIVELTRAKGMAKVKAKRVANAEAKRIALSRSERKRLGLEGVDEGASYETLQPLHRLWTGYMHQLLGILGSDDKPSPSLLTVDEKGKANWNLSGSTIQRMQSEVQKADLSGASIRVVAAGNPSLVGFVGLVVKETENTFIVAPRESGVGRRRTRTIPKHNLSITLSIPLPPLPHQDATSESTCHLDFQMHGNQMSYTMPFRATRKFKQKTSIHF